MPSPTRCHRHAANVWMAYCPDCTAWHLTAHIARGNGGITVRDPVRVTSVHGDVRTPSGMSGAFRCSVPTDPAHLDETLIEPLIED
jgi:hypothetical protein